jgi:hypothetical protein
MYLYGIILEYLLNKIEREVIWSLAMGSDFSWISNAHVSWITGLHRVIYLMSEEVSGFLGHSQPNLYPWSLYLEDSITRNYIL